MEIKKQAKKMRDALQQLIYKIINPLIHGMIKIGITPNVVTTIGFLGNLAGACILIYAGAHPEQEPFTCIGWAGGIILLSSLFDMMDGQVARIGNMASTFGLCARPLQRTGHIGWYYFLSVRTSATGRCSDYICCSYRLIDGQLCTSSCRRSGTGMQNRIHAASGTCSTDLHRTTGLWNHSAYSIRFVF